MVVESRPPISKTNRGIAKNFPEQNDPNFCRNKRDFFFEKIPDINASWQVNLDMLQSTKTTIKELVMGERHSLSGYKAFPLIPAVSTDRRNTLS